jgi:hypothetical protein
MEIMMITLPSSELDYEKVSKDFRQTYLKNSKERFGFTSFHESSVTYKTERNWNSRSVVSLCKEQQMTMLSDKCEKIFKYSFSNRGICLAYNGLPMSSVLATSNYKDIVTSVFEKNQER